ncbi:MAG: hypothetical protein ACYS47_17690, partial [Planctomycetota bacterium]
MEPPKNQVCPECRYLFIGPIPHFCPRCHVCLHGSTIGTETRTITVTFRSRGEGSESDAAAPPKKCATCDALIIGPAVDGCPACGRPLEAMEVALPEILEVEPAPPPAEPPPDAAKGKLSRSRRSPATFAAGLWRTTVTGLRQSPCWILSLGIHVLAFLFLAQLVFMMDHASPEDVIML